MSEKELLLAVSSGDAEAFEQIFFIYQPRLIYFLTGFIHDAETSKDMAQDIFFSLWKDRHKLRDVNSFSSYLFTIARFTIYNYFDHLVTQNKYTDHQLLHIDSSDSYEEQLFVRELQALIDEAVLQMPPQQQRVYRMSREEGMTNDAIAETLGISKRTVENHITSALSVLRKIIYNLIFLI